MADSDCTVQVFPTEVLNVEGEPQTLWHWKRLNANGGQIDGSGAQRNGLETKKAVRELVKDKYPDDKLLGG